MAKSLQSSWWVIYENWPLDRIEALERACDRFEAALKRGGAPEVSDFLREVPDAERSVWLAEFLAIEIHARWMKSERLILEELLARFPGQEDTVRLVWQETAANLGTFVATQQLVARSGTFFQPGEMFDGRYEIERFLAAGGMAELYKARRVPGGLPVAIKVLLPAPYNAANGDPDWFLRRFQKEMQIGQVPRHPNLVTALDYVESPNRPPAIVMDWIEGRTLDEEIALRKSLPWQIACEIIRQSATGLGFAWQRYRLVHRDIKPSNIKLTPDGYAVVLDFGLARAPQLPVPPLPDGATSITDRFGSVDFTAPEQWEDASAVGPTADVYSLGATLYYLLAGTPPFASVGAMQDRMQAHLKRPVPDIRATRPDIPAALSQLLMQMLAKAPEARPDDAEVVAQQLERWTQGVNLANWFETGTASPQKAAAPTRFSPALPRLSRRTALWTLAGATAITACGWNLGPWWLLAPHVKELRVTVFERLPGNTFQMLGEIGETVAAVRPGNEIQITIHLDSACHMQLFEGHPDGSLRPLLNCGPVGQEAHESTPGRALSIQFPRQGHYRLDDLPGFEAFILIAGRRPLPPFDRWIARAELEDAWISQPDQAGVWRSDGDGTGGVELIGETPRGQIVPGGPEPLSQLLHRARSTLGDSVRVAALAFKVQPY